MPPEVVALQNLLAHLPSGRIPAESRAIVERALFGAWTSLRGSSDGGLESYKVLNRTEDLEWAPPCLSFVIERHGATVSGSKWADLQYWSVDVAAGTAGCTPAGRRLLRPMQRRLDVKPLAAEVARAITSGANDERIKWLRNGKVRILTGNILPASAKQTFAGRSKRFRAVIGPLLHAAGWIETSPLIWRRDAGEG